MSPRLRKLALTAHVAASVGLLGAVAAFLALAVTGLAGSAPQPMRAAYIAGGVIVWHVILPLNFAALLTGVVQSLGTPWGLLRHYWVVIKLLLTALVLVVLLLQLPSIDNLAELASEATIAPSERLQQRRSLVIHAGGGLLVLLLPIMLSLYKPRGLTRYGWRKAQQQRAASQRSASACPGDGPRRSGRARLAPPTP